MEKCVEKIGGGVKIFYLLVAGGKVWIMLMLVEVAQSALGLPPPVINK